MLKKQKKRGHREDGQALIEFIMLIPLLLTFLWYMIHVNVAINKSIVGQKHARSQLFLKMYNHRSGPVAAEFGNTERSHYYLGVSGEIMPPSGEPTAPYEVLGMGMMPAKKEGINDEPDEAPGGSLRQRVRIRTVFGICTHRKKLPNGSGLTDFCGSVPAGN